MCIIQSPVSFQVSKIDFSFTLFVLFVIQLSDGAVAAGERAPAQQCLYGCTGVARAIHTKGWPASSILAAEGASEALV